jgi:hypothetical protein
MKTTITTPKPPFNEWIVYIINESKKMKDGK